MTWVRRIGLHLGAQSSDVDVDQASVAEVPVAPHLVEEGLPAEHPSGVLSQLDEQAELGLGEVDLFASEGDLALFGDDLEVAEGELVVAARDRAHAPQQR